jgi:hypothetical protein
MKKSISLIVLAAGWLLATALASGPVPSPAGLPPARPTRITPSRSVGESPLTPSGPSASALPWLASILNGEPQPRAATGRPSQGPVLANPRVVGAYGQLPLSFEANQGQTASEVKFLARGSGYALFLTPGEAVLTLQKPKAPEAAPLRPGPAGVKGRLSVSGAQAPLRSEAPPMIVRLKLVGANPNPTITGMDELPGRVNYLRGNDPQQWHTNLPTYGKVKYAQAYPGIDLLYYGNPRQLEHDFVVAPGADPSVIAMEVEGPGPACLDSRGDLVWVTAAGEVRLQEPRIYQEVAGRRREVAGGYAVGSGRRVGFRVGAYDARRPLVIDPVLVYATYLGGSGDDWGLGIAVDAAGNAYVTGLTTSSDFPGTTGSPVQPHFAGRYDAFVAKLNAAGTALVYATYLGGNGDTNHGSGIAVDAAGNAYVTGWTDSADFPGTVGSPIQPSYRGTFPSANAFVAKLNADGSALLYATYLSGNTGGSGGSGIAVDAAGNAYVTGSTSSTDFPLAGSPFQSSLPGSGSAFVAKLNAEGSALLYSTYLGGSVSEEGEAIAVDVAGNAYVTGQTGSPDFPGTAGSPIQPRFGGGEWDGFVAKLNAAGSALVYATYLGGNGNDDYGSGIAVDAAGNAYVTGYTDSTDFPLAANPIQSSLGGGADAFVAKINPAGSALVYSTYLGGNGRDWGDAIAVDAAGNAYVTGYTDSTDFPLAGSPLQSSFDGGGGDAFVAKLNAAGSALAYATYLGGNGYDEGLGIAVDAAGNAYVTGETSSPNFSGTASSPLQPTLHSQQDAFVAKIGSGNGAGAPLPPSQVATTASGLAYSRVSQTFNGSLTLTNTSPSAISGPLQILFTGLTPGVTLVNATNTLAGTPYLTVPALAGLPPGQSVTLGVQFKNPSNAPITFTPAIYSGSF